MSTPIPDLTPDQSSPCLISDLEAFKLERAFRSLASLIRVGSPNATVERSAGRLCLRCVNERKEVVLVVVEELATPILDVKGGSDGIAG